MSNAVQARARMSFPNKNEKPTTRFLSTKSKFKAQSERIIFAGCLNFFLVYPNTAICWLKSVFGEKWSPELHAFQSYHVYVFELNKLNIVESKRDSCSSGVIRHSQRVEPRLVPLTDFIVLGDTTKFRKVTWD